MSAFRGKLSANDLNCVDVPLNSTHSLNIVVLFSQINQHYSIPTTSQRFIVGRVWPKDSDVLSHCGLLADNAELFVYIMSSTITPTSTITSASTITAASTSNGKFFCNM